MPSFTYKAKRGPTDVISDTIIADSLQTAVNKIIAEGLTPIDVRPQLNPVKAPSIKFGLPLKAKAEDHMPLAVLAVFLRQMYDLTDAGVPLLRSLELLSRQQPYPIVEQVVSAMSEDVRDGASFSSAMARHPKSFRAMHVNMIKTAEAAGNLPEILLRLAQFAESELALRARVKSALVYPMVILVEVAASFVRVQVAIFPTGSNE